jgi:hypothetical protein
MTMDSRELAKALAEKAKAASIPYSEYEAKVDYPFALGYLTGTVQDLLLRLSPGQRETIAKQYGLR